MLFLNALLPTAVFAVEDALPAPTPTDTPFTFISKAPKSTACVAPVYGTPTEDDDEEVVETEPSAIKY